jgi:hypothetical protein
VAPRSVSHAPVWVNLCVEKNLEVGVGDLDDVGKRLQPFPTRSLPLAPCRLGECVRGWRCSSCRLSFLWASL